MSGAWCVLGEEHAKSPTHANVRALAFLVDAFQGYHNIQKVSKIAIFPSPRPAVHQGNVA